MQVRQPMESASVTPVADTLKSRFGPEVVHGLAADLAGVAPTFDVDGFTRMALDGFEDLELTDRSRHIARALAVHLPADPTTAMHTIVAALGAPLGDTLEGMDAFRYMPYGHWVAEHGLADVETALDLQHALTQRFTAEFSIRAFIQQAHEPTMARLRRWAVDENHHVRRLVSEGTRPRLPWAPVLRDFVADPSPILPLLEALKDDPSDYVRRSVANNLNDIAKDHPDLVVRIAQRWWADATDDRQRLVRHALRTLVKRGHAGALAVLGYDPAAPVVVDRVVVEPPVGVIGQRVRVAVDLRTDGPAPTPALVDLVVGFVKADGSVRPKVFKGAALHLEPGVVQQVGNTISLRQHTTRTHHPGTHTVAVQVNGRTVGRETPFEVVG